MLGPHTTFLPSLYTTRPWQDHPNLQTPRRPSTMQLQVLILAALLSTFVCVSTSSPVLDYRGNPVTTDAQYTIEKEGFGFFGGLILRSINDSSCAKYAGFSNVEVERGIAVRFRPYYPGNTLQTGHGYRFKIEFTSTPSCVEGGEWAREGTYVVAGGKVGGPGESYFAVLEEERGKYKLGVCGPCPVCRNLCLPLATDDLFLKTDGKNALNVYFAKSYCAADLQNDG